MKILFVYLALSVSGLVVFTTSVSAQQSGDEVAIRKVIDDFMLAEDNRDSKAVIAHFVQSPGLYFQVTPGDGRVVLAHGYENVVKIVGGRLQDMANVKPPKHTISRYTTHINGASAWVTFTLTAEMPDGEKVNSCQFSVLEKKAESWKIAAMTWQDYADDKLIEIK
ncbi:nuclear transport factor 2 family protein [Spirosoma linguale]|uniref:SnoaL-like domain-containing protein n=1 Tax=Spirosoma linguale (strain ATCC 33905 / DSM 74 / LMG 10896 / Claus 1) TaxID=504472 RepID=D2QQ80_SPILD|nr:hypothetical protein Slin_3506 [Spirosoma linguale DSM 74]